MRIRKAGYVECMERKDLQKHFGRNARKEESPGKIGNTT
jgi:hypothetical protein